MERHSPNLYLVLAVAASAALPACTTVTRHEPNLVGQDVRLTIIHTADIHSRLFPYTFVPNRFDQDLGLLPANAPFGGVARMDTIIKHIRATSNRSIWLDSGDCFQGAPVFNMFKGEPEMRSLSAMGLQGEVLGNHEFDLGTENLYQKIDRWAQYPEITANYAYVNGPARSLNNVVEPYQIFDVKGIKIGVIGMANHSSMTGIYEAGNSLGIRPIDNDEVVKEYVRLLRPAVDVVVILSHLGLNADEGLAAYQVPDMNATLPLKGVDVILGGHLHIVLDPPNLLPNDNYGHKTIIADSGAFAKYVGRLDLVVHVGSNNADPMHRSYVTAFNFKVIPVDSRIAPDAKIAELLQPYRVKLNQAQDLHSAFAYVNTASGKKIVRNAPNGGDSQLGNMVARSMQVRPGIQADFSLTNSLGIRADFERGPLDLEDMYNVFPFENTIEIMYLSGTEVQEMLDYVAQRSAGRGCRTQAQVSGIWFDMVCHGTCPGGATACAKNIYLGADCRDGHPDGPVDPAKCAPLESSGLYKVAVNNYIAAGGSGFDVLRRNTSKQDTGVSLRDALVQWLRTRKVCNKNVVDATDASGKTVVQKYGNVACLDDSIEPHDGRIRPVFE